MTAPSTREPGITAFAKYKGTQRFGTLFSDSTPVKTLATGGWRVDPVVKSKYSDGRGPEFGS